MAAGQDYQKELSKRSRSVRDSGDFFFQAEDGIRDLVRSRGLGDVYKRQYETLGIAGFVTIHRHKR